jgi:arylsulfatase A-like enzyme
MERLGLADETLLLFMSDHGILLGERGLVGKKGRIRRDIRGWPAYPEIARIPMMIRAPGIAPRRSDALVHPGDLAPTALDLLRVTRPSSMKTASLAPLLRGEVDRVRETAVSSWSLQGWSAGRPSVIRTEEWSLAYWRAGLASELYHRATDPGETRNVIREYPREARELHSRYLEFLRRNDTPAKHYYPRRWLVGGAGAGEPDVP